MPHGQQCRFVASRRTIVRTRLILLLSIVIVALAPRIQAQRPAESKNIVLLGHNDLNGNGDGGEGMAIQRWPGGRRILYLAHEGQKTCLSIIDVTHPENPVLLNQLPSPQPGITRCNSLGRSGNVLAVANQTLEQGQKTAGMWVLDVSDPERVQKAKTLQDLAFSFFETSGPHSRGVHCLWFVDGEFAHLSTGMPDFTPTNPKDDQFYVVVDLRDPRHPHEVGRWWYPGQRQGGNLRFPAVCLRATRSTTDTGHTTLKYGLIIRNAPTRGISTEARSFWISPDFLR